MEEGVARDNLQAALARVRQNQGSPGIDGMSTEELVAHLREHWLRLREELLAGTYQPQPVKRGEIPQKSGGRRHLGIPMVPSYCTSIQAAWGLRSLCSGPGC
jgi:RNA-directed DNA polymerase